MSSFKGPRIRATKTPYQYPYMQYPYQNVGTQLTWRSSPPYQSHGADAASLGSYERTVLNLPLPGGPEVIPARSGYAGYEQLADCGCGCKGSGACSSVGDVDLGSLVKPVAIGLGALLLFRALKKKRRR